MLASEGYAVHSATDGKSALALALSVQPDVVLLDVMMPNLDGIEVCRRLRADPRGRRLNIILLTAKTSVTDRLQGLRAGADDYVNKPFDPEELLERIGAAVRRRQRMIAANPLTGLPGNEEIRQEINDRLASGAPFALLHVDVDNFKAFNDYYGVLHGDSAIEMLAGCVKEAAEASDHGAFIGHIGGDDMVVMCEHEKAEALAQRVIDLWEASVDQLYDRKDLMRGFIQVIDRRNEVRRFPIMSLSVGIATNAQHLVTTHWEIADVAGEMKSVAKRDPFSSYAIDRRSDGNAARREPPLPGRMTDERPQVLIADDDEDLRDILRMHCELSGYEVVAEASDGLQAYLLASRYRPALVFLDYRMPEMNGEEAATLIRAELPNTTIVAFTGLLREKPDWADEFVGKEDIKRVSPLLARFLDLPGESA